MSLDLKSKKGIIESVKVIGYEQTWNMLVSMDSSVLEMLLEKEG